MRKLFRSFVRSFIVFTSECCKRERIVGAALRLTRSVAAASYCLPVRVARPGFFFFLLPQFSRRLSALPAAGTQRGKWPVDSLPSPSLDLRTRAHSPQTSFLPSFPTNSVSIICKSIFFLKQCVILILSLVVQFNFGHVHSFIGFVMDYWWLNGAIVLSGGC